MQLNIPSNSRLFLPPKTVIPSFMVKGVVKTNSADTAGALVRLFARSDAALVGQVITKADGSYKFTVCDEEGNNCQLKQWGKDGKCTVIEEEITEE